MCKQVRYLNDTVLWKINESSIQLYIMTLPWFYHLKSRLYYLGTYLHLPWEHCEFLKFHFLYVPTVYFCYTKRVLDGQGYFNGGSSDKWRFVSVGNT